MQDAAAVATTATTTVGDLLDRALELRALREVAAAATRAPAAGREALREVGARLENLAAEVVQVRGKDELARAPAQREAAAGRHYRGLAAASAALAESIRAKRAELETAALQVEELQRAIAMREAFLADPANARALSYTAAGSSRPLLGGGGGGGDPYDDLYDYYSEEEEEGTAAGSAPSRAPSGGEPQRAGTSDQLVLRDLYRTGSKSGSSKGPSRQPSSAAAGSGGGAPAAAAGGVLKSGSGGGAVEPPQRKASVGFADEGPEGARVVRRRSSLPAVVGATGAMLGLQAGARRRSSCSDVPSAAAASAKLGGGRPAPVAAPRSPMKAGGTGGGLYAGGSPDGRQSSCSSLASLQV